MTSNNSDSRTIDILGLYLITASVAFAGGLLGWVGSRYGWATHDLTGLTYVGMLYLLLAANLELHNWRDRRDNRAGKESPEQTGTGVLSIHRPAVMLTHRAG